ncbi:MAG TPA: M48 family metalloprotease [Vicinamibacterales bacterium]|nr:M48 family metalloprotease [Vicinamibacterales bacterium]
MKHAAFALALVLTASPAYAQLGGLGKAIRVKEKADKIRNLVVTEADERKIGEKVSDRVRVEFGVFQDQAVTRYVTLVGTMLTQNSSRPDLKWEFIVLDTDGVNAFASPGGLVHITRGALGLIKSEAELAGVLGHEIAHITRKHTVNAIKKNATVELGVDVAPGTPAFVEGLANAAYDNIVEKGFDRGDEEDADEHGILLANKAGYNPSGLGTFLTKLAERNKEQSAKERNGLFASHPETQGRIDKLTKQITTAKLNATATVQPRYASHITFDAPPLSEIAMVVAGTRGVAGATGGKEGKAEEKEKPKKRGFGLGSLGLSSSPQAESKQASASAGNRAVGADRAAPGGPNPSKVTVPALTPADLQAFKQGIAG